MKVGIIIQARSTSVRLPGKCLRPFWGPWTMPRVMLWRLDWRFALDDVVAVGLAVPRADADLFVDSGIDRRRLSWAPGVLDDVDNVLGRYAATCGDCDVVVRLTSDCPLIDPGVVFRMIRGFGGVGCDYYSTSAPERVVPSGFDVEVFSAWALQDAAKRAKDPADREHVTRYFYMHPERYRCAVWAEAKLASKDIDLKLSVDTQDDFDLVQKVFETAVRERGPGFDMDDAIRIAHELAE